MVAGIGRLFRSVWPRISSAGAAASSVSVDRSSQLPRLLARAAGDLPDQGDEPYTAEPPPVAGTLCMLLLLSRSRGALLVHACMSSAMRFPYGFPSILVFQHLGYYLKGVTNHWTANHWTGLDWNPKICLYALWYAICHA